MGKTINFAQSYTERLKSMKNGQTFIGEKFSFLVSLCTHSPPKTAGRGKPSKFREGGVMCIWTSEWVICAPFAGKYKIL